MDKKEVLDLLIEQIKSDFKTLKDIANQAQDQATHEDLKPDGKYDTQAIEAGYLAGAQAKRVQEIQVELNQVRLLELKRLNSVQVGALIETKEQGWFFISPSSGGRAIQQEGIMIKIISSNSPVGSQIIGAETNDVIELNTPKGSEELTILKIF